MRVQRTCVCVCVCACTCVRTLWGRPSNHVCAVLAAHTPRRAPRGGSRIVYTAFLYQATTGSCKKSTYFTSCVHSRHQSSNTHVRRVYCFTGIQLYRCMKRTWNFTTVYARSPAPFAVPTLSMRTDLQGNPNRPSSAPRAYSPCRIALYPGRAPFWPPRGARRNLRMRYRLIWAVAKRRAHQSCIDRRSGPNRVGASRMAARARRRKVLRPDRPPKANARSPPDQMACFSSPAPGWLLGSRTVVLLALLVVYKDHSSTGGDRARPYFEQAYA